MYSTAFLPISGATVQAIDGPVAGEIAITDAKGWFSFLLDLNFTGNFTARVTSQGYRTETKQLSRSIWFFYMTLNNPSVVIEPGAYDMTFEFDHACSSIPEPLRRQTFPAAVIDQRTIAPAGTLFDAYVTAPNFFEELNYFKLGVEGDQVAVALDWGPMVWQVPPLHYFEVSPDTGLFPHNPPPDATLAFHTQVNYCELTAPMVAGRPCNQPELVKVQGRCDSPKNRVTLTRK